MTKAVYVPNAVMWAKWTYFIYYYDLIHHTFYINDIEWPCIDERVSVINGIETIVTKMYLQEIHSYGDIVKQILRQKLPKIIYFYQKKNTKYINIDSVKLKPVFNRNMEIVRFKAPTWDKENSQKLSFEKLGIK